MAKDKLGFVCIDVRDGMPLSVREENSASDDGVNMGSIVLGMIPILCWFAAVTLLPLAIFAAAVLRAVKAFRNEWFKLPVIGDFAEKQAGMPPLARPARKILSP